VIPKEPLPRAPGNARPVTQPITDRLVRRGIAELEATSSGRVEMHETSFGYVLVVPATPTEHVAFAIDGSWPHKVLQIDWMDRNAGTSEELAVPWGATSIADLRELVGLFDKAKGARGHGK